MPSKLINLWPGFQYKDHQVIGVNWMLSREKEGAGGLLCDDMGLGKTIQMAGLIKNGRKKAGESTLLIAPVAVLEQWKTVLKRSYMNVFVPASSMTWRKEYASKSLTASDVYVIGYESALRKTALLKAYTWTRVVYDEAHRLASNNTSTKLAQLLKTKRIWLLTGTPIVNKVKDLVTLLEIAGIEVPKTSDLETLIPILKKYVMARSMDQLRASIADAPPKPEFKSIMMDFNTEDEREFYKGMTGIICRRWKALDADGGGQGQALERLKLFMRLRQLSLHPQVYIAARKAALKSLYTRADWDGSSTKFDMLKKVVCEATGATGAKESHKWIIFCHFRHEMDMLHDMFRTEAAIELVQQYHGGLTAVQKHDVLDRTHMPLMEGKQEVLLVQLQSGGTGLNLQHFDQIIFTGPWWTKALMDQAVGRAVRIGQKKVVTVYNLCLKEEEALNIDTYMFERANAKGELCKKVLESANTTVSFENAQSY
jgi:SNF2 family DNA or RNA helicase